jgi:capsule polysaccharide modification protein KpsS
MCLCAVGAGIRGGIGDDYLVPDYNERYYYTSLADKIIESMSINNCTLSGAVAAFPPKFGGAADIDVQVVSPPATVLQRWGAQDDEKHQLEKVFLRTSKVRIKISFWRKNCIIL